MRHGNTGYKAKSYKGQIFVPAYSLKTHIAHIFLYKTITSKYSSAELAFTQHTAVSAMLCQQVLKKIDQRRETGRSPTVSRNPNLLACQGIMYFCAVCDTVESDRRWWVVGWSAADSNHFGNLGADSVGGKCD